MSGDHVRVSAGSLGVGGNDNVDPPIQRPLQKGRARGVVSDDDRACLACPLDNQADITNIESGVARRFDEQYVSIIKSGICQLTRSALVYADPECCKAIVRQATRRVVTVRRNQEVLALPECCEQSGRNGCHARCKQQAGSFLENGELVLHTLSDRRVVTPVIERFRIVGWQVKGRTCSQRQCGRLTRCEGCATMMEQCGGTSCVFSIGRCAIRPSGIRLWHGLGQV